MLLPKSSSIVISVPALNTLKVQSDGLVKISQLLAPISNPSGVFNDYANFTKQYREINNTQGTLQTFKIESFDAAVYYDVMPTATINNIAPFPFSSGFRIQRPVRERTDEDGFVLNSFDIVSGMIRYQRTTPGNTPTPWTIGNDIELKNSGYFPHDYAAYDFSVYNAASVPGQTISINQIPGSPPLRGNNIIEILTSVTFRIVKTPLLTLGTEFELFRMSA